MYNLHQNYLRDFLGNLNTAPFFLYFVLHFFLIYRSALEQFVGKHYLGAYFAFDGRRNMYTTKELKGVHFNL